MNVIGQRTGVTTSGTAYPATPSWLWSYDAIGQVIAADSTVATSDRSYQYDTIGNRQKSADSLTLPVANNYTTNALNQYTSRSVGGSSTLNPFHDFDGNMTSGPLPTARTVNSLLVWDGENRLTRSTVGSVTTSYKYDAQSRRIAKIAGTATTSAAAIYLYDAWNCIADYSRSAGVSPTFTLKKTRLWGSDLSNTPQAAGGVAGLLSESLISNPQSPIYYPTYDGNGNISEYLTSTGTIAAHFEYDPFGNTVVNTDTGNLFTYRFSTKPRDTETGLYYYGYRYYDPMTGRWPSRDPIEESGGVNLYGFVGNDPLSWIDILGLKAKLKCTRCKKSGIMRCKTIEDGKKANDPFTTNNGKDKDGKQNKNEGQVPEGTYDLKPKDNAYPGNENLKVQDNWNGYQMTGPGGPEYPLGTPSITGPGLPTGKPSNKGNWRATVRVHGKGKSTGCTATDKANEIRKMMDRNPGETKMEIKNVPCKCVDGEEIPASDP